MDLPLLFALTAALCAVIYVLADGFDLGVGILFLFVPQDEDRDLMMESIAPFWDGNETWLVAGGTLLLAAFPPGYYVLLPAFYSAIVPMLLALILRGAAFEFRFHAGRLRRPWDWVFAVASLVATFSQGLVLGGFIQGVRIRGGAFAGGTFDFVSLLGLFCACGLIAGYCLLGAGWLVWKTTGSTQIFGRQIAQAALIATMTMMALVSFWTAWTQPVIAVRWFDGSWYLAQALLPIAVGVTAITLHRCLWGRHDALPFALGLVIFLGGFGGLAFSLWPYLVPRQITIWQGAGDPATLRILGVGTVVILPLIVTYLSYAYWTFRGKIVSIVARSDEAGIDRRLRDTPNEDFRIF